jgi:hypothetical protein
MPLLTTSHPRITTRQCTFFSPRHFFAYLAPLLCALCGEQLLATLMDKSKKRRGGPRLDREVIIQGRNKRSERLAGYEIWGRLSRADRTPLSAQIKSPEVVLISFVSASSSRLDPHSTCSRRFLAGCNARSSLGLRAHRQPDKPVQRLGTLSCLRAFVLVLLDQRFAIDPR